MRRPSKPTEDAVSYDVFSRYVRQFKTTQLLRLIARHQHLQWLSPPGKAFDRRHPIVPHAASLVAFEAMGGWGAQGQCAPKEADLRDLNEIVIGLEDPFLSESGPDGADGIMLRISFQQFIYQQSPFNDAARLRPMLSGPFPSNRYDVIDAALVTQLLGTDIDTYADLAPLFLAAVMQNGGVFNPGWFSQPNFAEVNARLSPAEVFRVFDLMRADPSFFRAAARQNRHADPWLRQYDFNPFIARPFVNLPGGTGLAPQPTFVTGRFAPSAVFYGGLEHFKHDAHKQGVFLTDLGYVNEDYALKQMKQLEAVGVQVDGDVEYTSGKRTVDVSVVFSDHILLAEVKSARPLLPARQDLPTYRDHLRRDVGHAIEQLVSTHSEWLSGNPQLAYLPSGLPMSGLVVVPEPMYLANWTSIRSALPSAPFDVAIISFTEMEHLVAAALHEGSARVFIEAAHSRGDVMQADVQGALEASAKRHGGKPPRNPLLDDSFDKMRWR